jgi:hypothetical protein
LFIAHVVRHGQRKMITWLCRSPPEFFQLLAGKIRWCQVLEAPVHERRRFQVEPIMVLNAPRLETGAGPGGAAGDQAIIFEQSKARLTAQYAVAIRNQDSRVVKMCCQ